LIAYRRFADVRACAVTMLSPDMAELVLLVANIPAN
jgi:hypothetical protein